MDYDATIDASRFTWNAETQTYVAEASDLQLTAGAAMPARLMLHGAGGRPTIEFRLWWQETLQGEITGWRYYETGGPGRAQLLILND